ncbi:unnamed protein product, partial [Prorocentrum cordatum]
MCGARPARRAPRLGSWVAPGLRQADLWARGRCAAAVGPWQEVAPPPPHVAASAAPADGGAGLAGGCRRGALQAQRHTAAVHAGGRGPGSIASRTCGSSATRSSRRGPSGAGTFGASSGTGCTRQSSRAPAQFGLEGYRSSLAPYLLEGVEGALAAADAAALRAVTGRNDASCGWSNVACLEVDGELRVTALALRSRDPGVWAGLSRLSALRALSLEASGRTTGVGRAAPSLPFVAPARSRPWWPHMHLSYVAQLL